MGIQKNMQNEFSNNWKDLEVMVFLKAMPPALPS